MRVSSFLGIIVAKKYKKNDPHRHREKQKYQNPVPSREFILEHLNEVKKPVALPELLADFGLIKPEEQDGFLYRLKAMLRDGQLYKDRSGGFTPVDSKNLLAGTVQGHPDGYGFVIVEGEHDDIFLSEKEMKGVFPGDHVLVRLKSSRSRRRKEGRIIKVVQRHTKELVGRLIMGNGQAYVQPDDRSCSHRILLNSKDTKGAAADDYVVIRIVQQPTPRYCANGEIVRVIGDDLMPGLEVDLAISNFKIPHEWSSQVKKELKSFSTKVDSASYFDRLDLRHLSFVTIDGEDAQDFDDAVYCEPISSGWVLYVAIADVAHYVKPGSALDEEARLRGNSVYFPGRVVPMLPEVLSNGLCSLKPKEDRLTMVAKIHVNATGDVVEAEFYNAVIFSHARLTYSEVAKTLKEQTPGPLLGALNNLNSLYLVLHERRNSRGALDFRTTETQIVFNNLDKIDKIIPTERNDAHRLIEEFMLLANVAVAKKLESSSIPAIYRVHGAPDSNRVSQLRDFLKLFGLALGGGDEPSSLDFARVLDEIHQRDDGHLLQTTVLRTLSQAVYKEKNEGHFGLAYKGYTHFTSPIRRYPDLMVHRALKWVLSKNKPNEFPMNQQQISEIAAHCSLMERRADLATRDATDRLKCDYMEDKLGAEFDGTVVDVTSFGLFVELNRIYVQGLVHVTTLKKDYYRYDELQRSLTGEKSGVAYRLGTPVRIIVSRVDKDRRFIDFNIA
jgi:ribonuclease R